MYQKKGLIKKHGRASYEGWPGNYLANTAKARTQLPNWQRNAIGTLLASCSAKIFQNLALPFAGVSVYLAPRPFHTFVRPSFAQFPLGIADLIANTRFQSVRQTSLGRVLPSPSLAFSRTCC